MTYDISHFLESNFSLPYPFAEIKGQKAKSIANSVMKLSDHYTKDNSKQTESTPWNEKWVQEAYAYYFLPLNLTRAKRVIEKGNELGFFDGVNSFVDFGAGPGTLTALLLQQKSWQRFFLTDVSGQAIQKIGPRWQNHFVREWNPKTLDQQNSLAVFSYVLNELKEIPEWALEYESILLIEPSTSLQARRLMSLREDLIRNNFSLWAPCTHHDACPLLKNSPTDWCHDAVSFQQPEWFLEIETHLPMKNDRLTHSYLLARKTKPSRKGSVRVIGDLLKEKGKRRQMICENDNRTFATWMDRDWDPKIWVGFERGELLNELPKFEQKSNEYRLKP